MIVNCIFCDCLLSFEENIEERFKEVTGRKLNNLANRINFVCDECQKTKEYEILLKRNSYVVVITDEI